jgi:beta-galactosidase
MLDLMEWHLQVQLRTPQLAGNAQWAFKDFGTPLRPENPLPYVNQKGLLDRAGRPKDLYYLFQSYLTTRPMCHIEAPTWNIRMGKTGATQRVRVYSNCPRVTLFLNGAECGELRRDGTAFPAAGLVWHVPLRPGPNELRAVAIANDGERAEHVIELEYHEIEAGPGIAFRRQLEPVLLPDGQAGTRVTIQLIDAEGHPVVEDRQRVSFSLPNAGELEDRLGIVGGSRVVELANGRASIVVPEKRAAALQIQRKRRLTDRNAL